MSDKEICPYCGNSNIDLYDTTYDVQKNETIGYFNCFKCLKGFDLSLGQGLTLLLDD